MPDRIPTGSITTPPVRKSAAAHPAVKPVENAGSKIVNKGGYTTTYNSKGQPTSIKDNKSGATAGTAYTKGFLGGGGTK